MAGVVDLGAVDGDDHQAAVGFDLAVFSRFEFSHGGASSHWCGSGYGDLSQGSGAGDTNCRHKLRQDAGIRAVAGVWRRAYTTQIHR